MKRIMIILFLLGFPFLLWAEFKTSCECGCHDHGKDKCTSCERYHEKDECPCHCHDGGATSGCATCVSFHEDFRRYGAEEAFRNLSQLLRYQSPWSHQNVSIPPLRTVHSNGRD